jgi:hypothetical protein
MLTSDFRPPPDWLDRIDRIERKLNFIAHLVLGVAIVLALFILDSALRALEPTLWPWIEPPAAVVLIGIALALRRPFRR